MLMDLTATILEMRRRAEHAAHGDLQSAQRLLEVERRRERALLEAIGAAEQERSQYHGEVLPALLLRQRAEVGRDRHQHLQRLRLDLRGCEQRIAELLQRIRQDRLLLQQCVQRREAAEVYEAREARERQRNRNRRSAANEDELASQKHSARQRDG